MMIYANNTIVTIKWWV